MQHCNGKRVQRQVFRQNISMLQSSICIPGSSMGSWEAYERRLLFSVGRQMTATPPMMEKFTNSQACSLQSVEVAYRYTLWQVQVRTCRTAPYHLLAPIQLPWPLNEPHSICSAHRTPQICHKSYSRRGQGKNKLNAALNKEHSLRDMTVDRARNCTTNTPIVIQRLSYISNL